MAQITTVSLMQALQRLEERVKKLEENLRVSDLAIVRVDDRLKNIEKMFESIQKFAMWGLLSPVVSGIVVVIFQHLFHF